MKEEKTPDHVTSMMWNKEYGPSWHEKVVPVNGIEITAGGIKAEGLDRGLKKNHA